VIARAERSVVAVTRTMPTQPAPGEPQFVMPPVEDLFGDLRQPAALSEQPYNTAAGVIIDPAGLVLTEYLAVREGDRHTVTTVDGTAYPATIKAADPRSGLAVLAIGEGEAPAEPSVIGRSGSAGASPSPAASPSPHANADPSGSLPAISFGDASQLRKGQFVVVIGNPYAIRSDGEPTASWGIVTNLARKAPAGANLNDVPGPQDDYRTTIHHLGMLIQTDAKLGWSAGGGALVNLRGELVGLTTTVATIAGHEQPAGYAIPIDPVIRRIIDTLKQGREVEYGLLGVTFRTRDSLAVNGRDGAVQIAQIVPGSPADRAGLQAGDEITQVAGRPTDNIDAIQLAISTLPPAQSVAIGFRRGDRAGSVTATLTKLSVPGHKIVTERPPSYRGMRIDFATALDQPALAERIASGALDQAGCVAVTEVEPDSPAWRAGVRPGMLISHVGTRRVTTPTEFRAAIEAAGEVWNLRFTEPTQQSNRQASPDLQIRESE
jgi:serine protease Do